MVRLFLGKGTDVNAVGGRFGTALCVALTSGHEDIARLLLEHRADIKEQVSAKLTKATESDSMEEYSFAIAAAAGSEKPELIQLLLDHGVEINADGEACASALWNAAVCSDTTMLKFLIANGTDIKRHGGNAIRGAVERHHPEHLDLLLQHGADVNFVNSNSCSNITSWLRLAGQHRAGSMGSHAHAAGCRCGYQPTLWPVGHCIAGGYRMRVKRDCYGTSRERSRCECKSWLLGYLPDASGI